MLSEPNAKTNLAQEPTSKDAINANSKDTKTKRSTRRGQKIRGKKTSSHSTRKRGRKTYPVVGIGEVLPLAEAIMKHNTGQPAKRITLLGAMGLEENAQSTRNLITNSNKYKVTEGSYAAEILKLTPKGLAAVNQRGNTREQKQARFELAISDIEEFNTLFEKRQGNNMPSPEMLHDDLQDLDAGDRKPCADVFISNIKFLGMLTPRDGAEYLMTFEEWLGVKSGGAPTVTAGAEGASSASDATNVDYERICFVMSTTKEPGTDERNHADVILIQYVERALVDTGLKLVRADKIGSAGMISKQIIEHIINSKLVVADLSFHNPNVFYELALRHVTGKPTVHLIQASDKIPFDLSNFRTIKINTSDKYQMVRELDTVRSEIATAIRQALADGESRDNPILTFCPQAKFVTNNLS